MDKYLNSSQDVMLPTRQVPESVLLAHPSRISNTYEPFIEHVFQPAFTLPEMTVTFRVAHGSTLPRWRQSRLTLKKKLRCAITRLRFGSRIDLGETLIYDARFVDNGNMAHLIQHHLAQLGFILATYGYGRNHVTVILDARTPALALDVFGVLGYETLSTDLPVFGNVCSIDANDFFLLLPYVTQLEFKPAATGMPKNVFIPRRSTRRLANESKVHGRLKELGFERVYFEDISIAEQWATMANAAEIVAIHGAALGCLAFHSPSHASRPFSLIELFGAGFVVNPFRKYMAVLQGNWIGCRGRITPEVVRDIDLPGKSKSHAFDDFEVSGEVVAAAMAISRQHQTRKHNSAFQEADRPGPQPYPDRDE